MVKIVTDSSSLHTKEECQALGIALNPLMVTLKGVEYRDYEDITTEEFCAIVKEGNVPKSSQPPIGEVVDSYESCEGDVINITIADGLSGTYQSAENAKDMAKNKDRITVFNSRTICGPQRYIVEMAASLAKAGKTMEDIINRMEESLSECQSFLIPVDFDFLKRGGRLTPVAATIGGFLKIVPVMTQSKDGKRLDKYHIARTMGDAFNTIVKHFESLKLDEKYKVFVSHANNESQALNAIKKLQEKLPKVDIELLTLSPAFVTQGGPGCIAIQFIKK